MKPPAKPAPVRPAPSTGYAFFEGSFQLSPSGREILRFTAQTTCAGQLVLPSIAVSRAGTFAFSGHPGGSPPGTAVRLRGRFASKTEVRGSLQVARNQCHDPATPFVAHLS